MGFKKVSSACISHLADSTGRSTHWLGLSLSLDSFNGNELLEEPPEDDSKVWIEKDGEGRML